MKALSVSVGLDRPTGRLPTTVSLFPSHRGEAAGVSVGSAPEETTTSHCDAFIDVQRVDPRCISLDDGSCCRTIESIAARDTRDQDSGSQVKLENIGRVPVSSCLKLVAAGIAR